MNLEKITRVVVRFSPWTGNAASAREFLARACSRKAQTSNPNCEISSSIRVKCDPYVEVTYENNETAHIETKDLNVEQIMHQINSVAEQMDTIDKLKAAGIAGQQLHSTWTSGPGRETGMGRRSNIPRQV